MDNGLMNDEVLWIVNMYGFNVVWVFSLIGKVELMYGLSLVEMISLCYVLDEEMILMLVDYLLWCINYLLFMWDMLDGLKDGVIVIMVDYFGWDVVMVKV